MKRMGFALLGLCMLVLCLSGCGRTYPFSGTYVEDGTGLLYEFNNSAQFLIQPSAEEELAVGGSFSWEEDATDMMLTLSPPGGTEQVKKVAFTLSEDGAVFTLTDETGKTSVLRKQ